jgi:hypothetical protein
MSIILHGRRRAADGNPYIEGFPRTSKPKPAPAEKPRPAVLSEAEVERLRPPLQTRDEPKPTPPPVEPLTVSLYSPSDVLCALESTFGEALALLER